MPTILSHLQYDSYSYTGGGFATTLAIGGANTSNYTSHTQIIGVGNTVTGTDSTSSKFNMVNGYKNTVTNTNHLSVIGAENTVTDTTSSILFGDHRTLTAANESVLIGGATKDMITNVAQLKAVAANPAAFNRMESSINRLSGRIDSLGASAAALAALHPQDYNSEDKWDIAAGYGNYHGSHALALDAFYRPTEKTMVSFSTNLGGRERLFNAGLSLKFGESNPYSTYSKSQLVILVQKQQEQIAQQQTDMQQIQEQLRRIMERLEIK